MKLGIRGKLISVSVLIIGVVGAVTAVYLHGTLRDWLTQRIETELLEHAQTAKIALESSAGSADALANALGDSSSGRISIINEHGKVLGDSELSGQRLRDLDNHAQRPEVIAAMTNGTGSSRRFSSTLNVEMQYVAVRYQRAGEPGVIRVALPLHEIETSMARLRGLIYIAGAIGLLVAILISVLASQMFFRTIQQIIDETGGQRSSKSRPTGAELKGSVAELRFARDRLETILRGISDAVLAIDGKDVVTLANPAARALLGLPEESEGKPIVELIDSPELLGLVASGRDNAASDELRIGAADQRVLVRAAPLRATGGVVLAMLDVTAMRRIEKVRRDFVANVSHELRTPVSIIQANSETLRDGALEDTVRARSFLEAIERNTLRISRLVSDLLDLSRIEAGQYTIEPRNISLRSSVENAIAGLADKLGEVQVVTDAVDDQLVVADASALEQVLVNLLDNASKYGAPKGTIEVVANRIGSQVRVEIRDDGPGIAPKHRPRLFERFYRVDRGRSRETGGTGLGLAIVKHLVETMGGEVGVEPVAPTGSAFWFSVPCPPA